MDEKNRLPDAMVAEVDAMKAVAQAISPLENDAALRVLQWAAQAKGISLGSSSEKKQTAKDDSGAVYKDQADLFGAAQPKTEGEKVLAIGYWFQQKQQQSDLDAQSMGSALKELGHRISNITKILGRLEAQKPQLVIQTRKTGSTQQARKRYRLTQAGIARVDRMLKGEHAAEKDED